jgi:hypothetical protein
MELLYPRPPAPEPKPRGALHYVTYAVAAGVVGLILLAAAHKVSPEPSGTARQAMSSAATAWPGQEVKPGPAVGYGRTD